MKNFLISESEKKEILKKHLNYKNILEENLKKTKKGLVVEQQTPMFINDLTIQEVKEKCTSSNVKSVITRFQNKLAIKVDGGPDNIRIYTNTPNNELGGYFKYTLNTAQTKILKTSAWSCPALNAQTTTDIEREKTQGNWKERKDIVATDAEINSLYEPHPKYKGLYRLKATTQISGGLTDEQKAFVKVWEKKGYKLNLTPEERATGLFKPYAIEGSEGIFPAPGLKMWASAESLKDSSLTNDLTSSVAAQTMDKEDCKKAITQFYTAFNEGTTLPNLYLAKEKVQRCKSKFYKRWSKLGMFDGGNNLDNMLDILSGKGEGKVPTLYGDDSKFRIQ
jgi:hypothetical protein